MRNGLKKLLEIARKNNKRIFMVRCETKKSNI